VRGHPYRTVGVLVLVVAVVGMTGWLGADAFAARRLATGCKDPTPMSAPPANAKVVHYARGLDAWYTRPTNRQPTIVMVHGYSGDRRDFGGFATDMQALGFGTLRIDVGCAHNGALFGGGPREAREVLEAVDYARNATPGHPVVLFGFSAGATEALLAADNDASIPAVVADSAPSNMLNIARYAGLPHWFYQFTPHFFGPFSDGGHLTNLSRDFHHPYAVPTLIIQGKADTDVHPTNGPRIAKLTDGQLWMVPGANHGQSFDREQHAYVARVESFYDKALHISSG
jgi:pimeloyl-ACP methyl ester carboxylesterase